MHKFNESFKGKNTGYLQKQADIVQRPFFPLLLTILALACRQSTVTQIVRRFDIFVIREAVFLGGKTCTEDEISYPLNGWHR